MTWIARGEAEAAAIQELSQATDRAAAIVAGALLEASLEQAIKRRLVRDEAIEQEMFRSSGPLGSFSAKIHLGFMLGMYDMEAHADLVRVKNIRNRFAHDLDLDNFKIEPARSMATHFKLIDKSIFEIGTEAPPGIRSAHFIEGASDKLSDPRWRYILTVMVLRGRYFTYFGAV